MKIAAGTESEQHREANPSLHPEASSAEHQRAADLLRLAQTGERTILDAGARSGYFSTRLADLSKSVTALDLNIPSIEHSGVTCVEGDITNLQFPDQSFDLVLCAEVLEHIPPDQLQQACNELARVSRQYVLIGVPYKQDIRVGRTTCQTCGYVNPPWGHVNSFDTERVLQLFSQLDAVQKSFIGTSKNTTNFLAARIMDLAGNPYGTYYQDEGCVSCGNHVGTPQPRSFTQKVLTRVASLARSASEQFSKQHPNWIHVLFQKKPD